MLPSFFVASILIIPSRAARLAERTSLNISTAKAPDGDEEIAGYEMVGRGPCIKGNSNGKHVELGDSYNVESIDICRRLCEDSGFRDEYPCGSSASDYDCGLFMSTTFFGGAYAQATLMTSTRMASPTHLINEGEVFRYLPKKDPSGFNILKREGDDLWRVVDEEPGDQRRGCLYRRSKDWNDKDQEFRADFNSTIYGTDEGERIRVVLQDARGDAVSEKSTTTKDTTTTTSIVMASASTTTARIRSQRCLSFAFATPSDCRDSEYGEWVGDDPEHGCNWRASRCQLCEMRKKFLHSWTEPGGIEDSYRCYMRSKEHAGLYEYSSTSTSTTISASTSEGQW